ncbi:ArsR/SmtB family transcription factor [Novosphingobium colocasiae]|uniref:ArsR/SmtB family transcription factor n=1 Tax=Novosphingobium colocasiae TaxID=1256513 RepID=UPI0035AE5BE9
MKIEPVLRAVSEPTRLRMVRLLAHMELAVGELAQVLGQSQPRVSRHIRILCDAGLAERRKEGSWVFLRSAIGTLPAPEADMTTIGGAVLRLLALAERDDRQFAARCEQDRRHLAAIRAGREANAAAYFERHAAEWDTMRRLHGADEPVEIALVAALADEPLGRVLDIGTGTGRMVELLSPAAARLTAIDKSAEMLRIARARLQDLPADKLDLVHGDFTALPFADAGFDTVLFHHVLHFAQDSAAVLAEAARVTAPGGRIAVVDLAAHDHEDLRVQHAHARLGFTDAHMAAFLADAGFSPAAPITLPGDPLTVKIWTGRRAAPAAEPRKALSA